ncbi:ATP-dependent DNA helicase RecG [Alicyclobacillus fastidiosus]|uniref:ATP-dependent DNA helicase RecG n=1 Tax=Alicyclobacillus fastidiosus TaxID=392011 RepID=A0ABY6ZC90_9BACL|nr:ATP-dependent DNA helicase RecG [Alicyclobacillus fastidiosus]WAH40393.1 ATP-dependent DNA helicase RecG [Alicyclobacillus fastidiosus]GMA61784.1 ATP-dependent DNA helicase RecG [Alicyclobacillus fastidiosus]
MNLNQTPVRSLPGVGPSKETDLAALGIHTIGDLLHAYPFRYEDRRVKPLAAWNDGERITVRATVAGTATVRWRGAKSMMTARLRVDGQSTVLATWFSQHYLKSKMTDGRVVMVTGKWNQEKRLIVVSETSFDASEQTRVNVPFLPVYHASKSFGSRQLHQLILKALDLYADELPELLPFALAKKYRLWSHRDAVCAMHQPNTAEDLRQARRRLAFEEFLLFQMQLHWFRQHRTEPQGLEKQVRTDALTEFAAGLPAPLTGAQLAACKEILEDLQGPKMMARLLQGDVGSGKTWVALFACYAAFSAGFQSALMAPTEILAEQHHREAVRVLSKFGMQARLLTGSVGSKERKSILDGLARGEVHVVIGTHALLTDDVAFDKLGLVITDEQHRFGVSQRSVLRAKGESPDVLMLSATPIPRTLALAVYGDVDVSVLNELPRGRQPIQTLAYSMKHEDEVLRLVRRALDKGQQAYIVAPTIEESETVEMAAVTEIYERLQDKLAGFQVQLLHGKMSAREKDDIMRDFRDKASQVLVATTVIEVGIDVPNATVMVIYNAERFGLAQLHQLRGRVGRGSEASTCVLLAEVNSDTAKARIETMVATQDGFAIAEKDLELRGPGEFLGVRQSGLPQFAVGDIVRDHNIMTVAREEATAMLKSDSFWLSPAYETLRQAIAQLPEQAFYRD